jgi:hypothetical protein
VILTEPAAGIGPVRLVLVTRSGTVRSVVLEAITSGTNNEEAMQEHREAALAVDFAGRRTFVLGAGQPVAEVSLDDLTVHYHALAPPALDPGTVPPGPAQPTGTQNPVHGPVRVARWLGHGRIAVSGHDSAVHGLKQADTPLGLRVIDTQHWTVRVFDPVVAWFDFARGTLLAASVAWKPAARRFAGFALKGLSAGGRVRFRLLRYRSTAPAPRGPWFVNGQHLYVQRSGREYELRDPHGGTLLRYFRTTTDPHTLFTWRPPRSAQ